MISWLFGGVGGGTLILKPDNSAVGIPGFPTNSSELRLTAGGGETVGILLDRFNTYRGPEAQIKRLYSESGAELPHSKLVVGNIVAIVKRI
jgi:hypothetical protein